MQILSLDLGLKRIGAAMADGQVVASLETIDSASRAEAISQILKICREEEIEKIILGVSKSESGEAEDMVRSFALEINKNIDIPMEFVDETLTSKEAERQLADLKINPRSKKYKKEIDRLSAKLILEQYLNQS